MTGAGCLVVKGSVARGICGQQKSVYGPEESTEIMWLYYGTKSLVHKRRLNDGQVWNVGIV